MKAVLHFNAGRRLQARLKDFTDPAVVIVGEAEDARFHAEMQDAEVLLHSLKPVTAAMIAAAPKLRLIQKIGVGVNTIDLEAAKAAGVAVTNMPGTNTQAVAEHTLALMLATLRRVAVLDRATREGRSWDMSPDIPEASGEIAGRTVGLVGYGAVPQRLARILAAFGAEVVFYNRTPRPEATAKQVSLDELLSISDIVSLHLPATAETRGLLNAEALRRMKRGAYLINTARGELVDEAALAELLHSEHLAGAGLDVFDREPVRDVRPLLRCPTVTLTPHIAWLTPETIERSLTVIVENCRRLADGRPLIHRVA